MSRHVFVSFAFAASLALASSTGFAADPTLHQVYQAAEAGHYREAQSMMDQVLRDHPQSAKAHFVEAELLAKQGRLDTARTEYATAERLEPGLPFAKPDAVSELRERLAPRHTSPAAQYAAPAAAPAFPWGLLVIGLLLVAAIIFFLRSRSQAPTVIQAPGNSFGYGPGPQPYGVGGPGPVVTPGGGGLGSGILGGLATGAAVGAGVVAGEALMHRVLDGGRSSEPGYVAPEPRWDNSQSSYDMGGEDFGVSDSSSWDDSSDSSGGDDWS